MSNDIIFWISFVGLCSFLVYSIHNSFVLRLLKSKEYPYSEFVFSIIFAILAILFVVMSMEYKMYHKENINKELSPSTEHHIPYGEIKINDSTTIQLFIKKE